MKKILAVLLALVLLLAGLFFWKGGHHAIYLAQVLEDWLDEDSGAAAVTVQYQAPGHSVDPDTGRLTPQVHQLSLSADGFWTEYADRTLYGMRAGEITVFCHGGNLYLDTGRAYALPDLTGLAKQAIDLIKGLVLYGRVTKEADTYQISMQTDALELNAAVTADRSVDHITLSALLPDGTAIHAALTPKESVPPPIPAAVTDAMVLAKMEPPMPLTEPLEALAPVFSQLLPLTADVKLGVVCGILNLSETVGLTVDQDQAVLTRNGLEVTLSLPEDLRQLSPLSTGLLLLRNGEFSREGEIARFLVSLPPETTAELMAQLVPQAASLGITFEQSEAELVIDGQSLSAIAMRAEGSVPFLITTIPVSFSAEFDIH